MTVRRDDREPKRWLIDFYYTTKDGERRRYKRRSTAATKSAAEGEERRLRNYIAEHGEPPASAASSARQRSFEEVAEEYLRAAKSRLKTSTYRSYEWRLRKHLIPALGAMSMRKIGFAHWTKVDAKMIKDAASASSRRNARIVFQAVCRHAVDVGHLDALPALPKAPKVRKQIREVLTDEEVDNILAACRTDQHKLLVMLPAFAGLRAGEVRGLRWRDVYLDKGYLIVRQSICFGVADTPKSGHERKVPIDPRLGALLRRLQARDPKGIVARSRTKEPWSEYAPANAFRRALKRAKLAGWRYHDLRHYFTTKWLTCGVPVHIVKEVVGHADLSTTQIYAHVTDKALMDAVSKVSGLHTGPPLASGGLKR